MLVARKSKIFNVSPMQNLKFDWKTALAIVDHKNLFFVVGQHWCKTTFFKISRLKLQKLLKSCWPS